MQTKKMILALLVGLLLVGASFSGTTKVAVADSMAQQEETQTVWDVIQADERLTDFAMWIEAAGLADNLDNDGPFTVFAPTNAAMADFAAQAATSSATPTEILLYHIMNGQYVGPHVANFSTLPTLLGEQTAIHVESGQILLNDTIKITTTDVAAANGVVHIVDSVLLPPVNSLITTDKGSRGNTVDEVLEADGRFTTFLSLLEKAGMKADLANLSHNYTVFAPTDAAFEELTENQINDWLTELEDIETLLAYHLVTDRLGINQIATDDYIPTAEGRPLIVSLDENKTVFLNNQPLEEFNIIAANGVIHAVGTVLMP
jgi:transforming growth factor-beta-induced protein